MTGGIRTVIRPIIVDVDLLILAGLLENSLNRLDLRCHLVLVVVGGAHLNVKVAI